MQSKAADQDGVEKVAVIVKEINITKKNWQAIFGDNRKCALKAVSHSSVSL